MSNMQARNLIDRRITLAATAFVELVVWELPEPVKGSDHEYKYRFALLVNDVCVLRYDNEAGKGDHVHVGTEEKPYQFVGIDRLKADFLADVKEWLNANGDI
jgi:hypothetical protein